MSVFYESCAVVLQSGPEDFRRPALRLQERDDDLALAVVPLSTREDFHPIYNARVSYNSIHLTFAFAKWTREKVVRREPALSDTCRHREQLC
jgi:hypothetical protein